MKTYTIKKDRHQAKPAQYGLFFGRVHLRYQVQFTESCRYYLEGIDSLDINKLIGVAYVSFPAIWFVLKSYYNALRKWNSKLIKAIHHYDSARIGFSYNEKDERMILHSYCYIQGTRVDRPITSVTIQEIFIADILAHRHGEYCLTIEKEEKSIYHGEKKKHSRWFSYLLSLMFGGNRAATHNMKIKMKKL